MSAAPVLTTPPPDDLAVFAAYLVAARRLAPASVEAYVRDAQRLLRALRDEGVDPDRATPQDLAAWDRALGAEYQTPTRLRHLSAASAFYMWRRSLRACSDHPLHDLVRPRIARVLSVPASETAAAAVVEAARAAPRDGARDALMATLVRGLGLRAHEVIEVRLPDLLLERGELVVRGTHARRVVLDAPTAEALRTYLTTVRPAYFRPNAESVTDHVFLTMRGSGMTRQGFWKLLTRHAHRAGVRLNARTLRRR